jgi:hypothetical protein
MRLSSCFQRLLASATTRPADNARHRPRRHIPHLTNLVCPSPGCLPQRPACHAGAAVVIIDAPPRGRDRSSAAKREHETMISVRKKSARNPQSPISRQRFTTAKEHVRGAFVSVAACQSKPWNAFAKRGFESFMSADCGPAVRLPRRPTGQTSPLPWRLDATGIASARQHGRCPAASRRRGHPP